MEIGYCHAYRVSRSGLMTPVITLAEDKWFNPSLNLHVRAPIDFLGSRQEGLFTLALGTAAPVAG
jgi:hypothetical protein